MTNQNPWLQDKGDGGQGDKTTQSKMHLRRRRNKPEKIRHDLRRCCISWQAKANSTTEKHTLCAYTGCAGNAEASRHAKDLCKRATHSLEDHTIHLSHNSNTEAVFVRLTVGVTRKGRDEIKLFYRNPLQVKQSA
ncbi:MAG: hypothetical protein QM730_04125 [Anaerolineales bacterium]